MGRRRITSKECANALESFQLNKAPGNDGIPIEFYKKNLVAR